MHDMIITIWLADPARLDEATDLLTGALAANESLINLSVTTTVDEDDARNLWLTVSYDWDPDAAQRLDDDFKLDHLVDRALPGGLREVLHGAGIEVAEMYDEQK